MLKDYVFSAAMGFVSAVLITLIWSNYKGLPTILTWGIGAFLGATTWWVYVNFDGAVGALLGLVLVALFSALIDWHQKAT